MRNWVKASATTAFLTAGLFAFGMGAAHADVTTSGDSSILGGNQVVGDVDVPVNVSGNSGSVLGGVSSAEAVDTSAEVADDGPGEVTTSGDTSIGGGNQVVGDVNVPVNVCGNAIAGAVGIADATCVGGEAVVGEDEGHGGGYPY